LFGSVIETVGKSVGNRYIIRDVLLQERKPSGIIHPSGLASFIQLDMENLKEMPEFFCDPLTNKKLKLIKSSPKRFKAGMNNNLFDEDDDTEDEDESDDDDNEPWLKSIA